MRGHGLFAHPAGVGEKDRCPDGRISAHHRLIGDRAQAIENETLKSRVQGAERLGAATSCSAWPPAGKQFAVAPQKPKQSIGHGPDIATVTVLTVGNNPLLMPQHADLLTGAFQTRVEIAYETGQYSLPCP